jgi:hypothetical protein
MGQKNRMGDEDGFYFFRKVGKNGKKIYAPLTNKCETNAGRTGPNFQGLRVARGYRSENSIETKFLEDNLDYLSSLEVGALKDVESMN